MSALSDYPAEKKQSQLEHYVQRPSMAEVFRPSTFWSKEYFEKQWPWADSMWLTLKTPH